MPCDDTGKQSARPKFGRRFRRVGGRKPLSNGQRFAFQALESLFKAMEANTPAFLDRFPVKNRAWTWTDSPEPMFTAEDSQLYPLRQDPWNRTIPDRNIRAVRNSEQEITHWDSTTTVAGTAVKLRIYND